MKAPACYPVRHFQAVRDDRNGSSRYRAAKMPVALPVIRVVPRVNGLAPKLGARCFFEAIMDRTERAEWSRNAPGTACPITWNFYKQKVFGGKFHE